MVTLLAQLRLAQRNGRERLFVQHLRRRALGSQFSPALVQFFVAAQFRRDVAGLYALAQDVRDDFFR